MLPLYNFMLYISYIKNFFEFINQYLFEVIKSKRTILILPMKQIFQFTYKSDFNMEKFFVFLPIDIIKLLRIPYETN